MAEPENFPGMTAFVVGDGLRPSFASRIVGNWFVARVGEMLSQIATTPPEQRAAMYAEARHALLAVHQCEATCLAAIDWMTARHPPMKGHEDEAKAETRSGAELEAGAVPVEKAEPSSPPKPHHQHPHQQPVKPK